MSHSTSSQTDYWTSANPNNLNDYDDGLPSAWINHEPKAQIVFQNRSLTIYDFKNAKINAWTIPDSYNWG